MLRAAVLSLLILVSVVVMLPAGDSSAHHNGRSHVSRRSNMGRRHSRAWWRRYRARMRRKRAAMRRRQALLRSRRGQNLNAAAVESHNKSALSQKISTVNVQREAATVSSPALPNGWARRAAAGGGTRFFLNSDGRSIAEATFAPVNVQASGDLALTAKAQRKMLAGVPFSELRRTVIDKMVAADGWVVNDMPREIGGRPVYLVIARTGEQSWVFYFTEVEGRIYSLAANSPAEYAARLADESAQLMASFHAKK
ncbi:MAG TPA: hypothetical protein VN256_23145 [Pyrinomonadaceae bacterium]|nr:hypothetical protein [Pyrinomonadaceae bacterium]